MIGIIDGGSYCGRSNKVYPSVAFRFQSGVPRSAHHFGDYMTEKERLVKELEAVYDSFSNGMDCCLMEMIADFILARDKKKRGEEITLDSLKANPLYDHINIDNEFLKAKQWIAQKGGRKLTPRFFVNWLNRIEKPLESTGGGRKCNQIQMEAF
jgi:hypothetical protein